MGENDQEQEQQVDVPPEVVDPAPEPLEEPSHAGPKEKPEENERAK